MKTHRDLQLAIWDKFKEYIATHVGKNGMRHINPTNVRIGTDYRHLCDSPHILQMEIEWVPGDTVEVYNRMYH